MKNMLEYSKVILDKVSFDPQLFRKELRKALRFVSRDEAIELIRWVRSSLTNKRFNVN